MTTEFVPYTEGNLQGWHIVDDEDDKGLLSYKKTFLGYYLQDVNVTGHEGQGYGRMLVEKFIETVGKGKRVTAIVSHKETVEYVKASNLIKDAWGKWKSFPYRVVADVPNVRFLHQSGLHITAMRVMYIPEIDDVAIQIIAHT